MPNWKKLIISGSDAELNTLNVTSVTASSDITTAGSLITTKTGSVTDPALLIGVNSGWLAGNNSGIILEEAVPGTTFFVPYFVSNGAKIFGFGTVMSMETDIDMQSNKIYFDSDVTNTYIASNADDPEDLEIHADQDVILNPDGQVIANSNISASGTITANSFTGDLTGNADTATTATNATNVNVGNSDDSSTYYIPMALSTGNQPLKRDSGITFDSAGNTLNIGVITISGKAGINSSTTPLITSGGLEVYSGNSNFGYNGTTNVTIYGKTGVIDASGAITGSDVYIDDWGSVSASLASAGGGTPTSYRTQIVSNGFYSQADFRYLTFNTTGETTTFNYLSLMPAPADGRVISISVWPQSNGGSTVMGFHLNSNATPASTDTQTLTAGTPVTFTFSSGNTFSQNDELSFSIDPTSTPNGLFFSIILEYDY